MVLSGSKYWQPAPKFCPSIVSKEVPTEVDATQLSGQPLTVILELTKGLQEASSGLGDSTAYTSYEPVNGIVAPARAAVVFAPVRLPKETVPRSVPPR